MSTPRSALTQELGVQHGFEKDARAAYDRALLLTTGDGEHPPTAKDFQALDKAYQHLLACRVATQRVLAQIEAYDRRIAQEASRRQRQVALKRDLLAQYGDLGPQYLVLVDRLISVVLQAEALEDQHLPFDPEEHRAITYQIKSLVDQLQKHTESVKQEVVNKKIETQVIRVLEVVERVVAPQSPVLWQNVVHSLESEMPRLDMPALAAEN